MTGDDRDLEDLQRSSTFGDRDDTNSDPYRQQREGDKDEERDPLEEMFDRLVDVREGDRTPSIGGRDDLFAAYLDYLKANPERMEAVCEELAGELEHPPKVDTDEKASVIRLLLRIGLQEGAPDEYKLITEANAEYARRKP